MRECCICRETKELDEFHRDKTKPGGRDYRCRLCDNKRGRLNRNKEYEKKWKENNRDKVKLYSKRWQEKNKKKVKVYEKFNQLIRSGKIKKGPCVVCGVNEIRVEAHHEDYTKPFEVVWLCTKHHSNLRIKRR